MKEFKNRISKINSAINVLNFPPAGMTATDKTKLSKSIEIQRSQLNADIYSFECRLKERIQAACFHDWRGSIIDHVKNKCEICGKIELDGTR